MTEIFQYFETTRIARYNPAIAFHSLKKYRDEIRYSAILNYAYECNTWLAILIK
jgi:hypothetical protein